MKNKEIDFKHSECIKEQHNIGETIYYNVCNNEANRITWGSDTWVSAIMTFILIALTIVIWIKIIVDGF